MLPFLSLVPFKGWLAIGLAGIVAGAAWYHRHEIGQREKEITSLTQQVKDEQLKVKNEENARLIVEKNRERLVFEVMMQNEMIEHLALEKRRVEQAGAAAAVRALARGRAEAEALRAPTSTVPSGAPGMNAWLASRIPQ